MLKRKYKFIVYQNIYDVDSILYSLDRDYLERFIDGVKFIEVTSDFKQTFMVRADSLKVTGHVIKEL